MPKVYIHLIHAAFPDKLAEIKTIMQRRGPPTVRVYEVSAGQEYMALEGTHRLQAAADLDMPVKLIVMRNNERMRHDLYDLPARCRVERIVEFLSTRQGATVTVDAIEIWE